MNFIERIFKRKQRIEEHTIKKCFFSLCDIKSQIMEIYSILATENLYRSYTDGNFWYRRIYSLRRNNIVTFRNLSCIFFLEIKSYETVAKLDNIENFFNTLADLANKQIFCKHELNTFHIINNTYL